ncbi:MAG: glycosyltransferase [Lachnospiraceae bacterium]|nr:glycosyltransferase [Lachnospiraceae bacterium]
MGTNRHYIKRGISYFKRNGLINTVNKGMEHFAAGHGKLPYVRTPASDETLAAQRGYVFAHPYKISILVPVYNTDPVLFRKMLESVGEQTYGNWELILCDASPDDSRRSIVRDFTEEHSLNGKDIYGSVYDKVRYEHLDGNLGISGNTNAALELATGDYVGLLDHDDLLENTALFDIMSAIEDRESSGRSSERITRVLAVYTDEDKVSDDGTSYFEPNIKPDFDPVLLCTNNYICHFFVADTNLAKGVGGFSKEYDGAQDHDFIIRCTEDLRKEQIIHVKKVLYHWRCTEDSTAANPDSKLWAYDAGKRAVAARLRRAGIDAKITDSIHLGFFKLEFKPVDTDVLKVTPEKLREILSDPEEFYRHEYIMVLSDSLRCDDPGAIHEMLSCMRFPNIGAVTGKIIGRDGRVESAGFDIDEAGNALPRHSGLKRNFSGYMHRADSDSLSEGFSPDCVLIRTAAALTDGTDVSIREGSYIYYKPEAVFTRRGK